MKLSTIHYQYMGELHAKLHQNWWSGFRDIALHDTEGHSFIIIRITRTDFVHPFFSIISSQRYFIKMDPYYNKSMSLCIMERYISET